MHPLDGHLDVPKHEIKPKSPRVTVSLDQSSQGSAKIDSN